MGIDIERRVSIVVIPSMLGTPEPNEQYADLSVIGQFDPEEISRLMGLVPTRTWKKGDVSRIGSDGYEHEYKHQSNGWSLHSRLTKDRSLEDHIADIFDQLDANLQNFKQISTNYTCRIWLFGYLDKSHHLGAHLDPKLIKLAGEYNLGFHLAFYNPLFYTDKYAPESGGL